MWTPHYPLSTCSMLNPHSYSSCLLSFWVSTAPGHSRLSLIGPLVNWVKHSVHLPLHSSDSWQAPCVVLSTNSTVFLLVYLSALLGQTSLVPNRDMGDIYIYIGYTFPNLTLLMSQKLCFKHTFHRSLYDAIPLQDAG